MLLLGRNAKNIAHMEYASSPYRTSEYSAPYAFVGGGDIAINAVRRAILLRIFRIYPYRCIHIGLQKKAKSME